MNISKLATIAIWWCACAGVAENSIPAPAHSPARIYVADFQLDPALVQVDQPVVPPEGRVGRLRERLHGPLAPPPADPQAAAQKMVNELSTALVLKLAASGIPAQRIGDLDRLPSDGWLLQGQFAAAAQGHAAMQATVGFGTGTPHMEIMAAVRDLEHPDQGPFLLLGENSKHLKLPGGLITMNPYVIAAKFVLAKGASDKDVQKIAGQLADELSGYIKQNYSR